LPKTLSSLKIDFLFRPRTTLEGRVSMGEPTEPIDNVAVIKGGLKKAVHEFTGNTIGGGRKLRIALDG
jgi:hypothetical protein